MKKALRETQTLRAGCSKAETKISPRRSPQTPFLGGAGRPKFNQLEMVTTFTYKPSLVKIDAYKFRVIAITDPPTHKHTHTHPQAGPITIHCAAASAQCN